MHKQRVALLKIPKDNFVTVRFIPDWRIFVVAVVDSVAVVAVVTFAVDTFAGNHKPSKTGDNKMCEINFDDNFCLNMKKYFKILWLNYSYLDYIHHLVFVVIEVMLFETK
jgi:hypothetical protein